MRTTTAGLSILAGGLAFVGAANAIAGSGTATNLIVNGSFELGEGVGWVGGFGTYNFSATYYAGPAIPASENPGDLYSWRHGLSDSDFTGPLTQTVALSDGASNGDIDAGRAVFVFSSWLASYTQNPEAPLVTLQFLDDAMNPVGPSQSLDRTLPANFVTFADGVTVFDRTTHEHYWAKYSKTGFIPSGARNALVGVTHSPNAAVSGKPDTYTDLVKLDVSVPAFVPPTITSRAPTGPGARPDSAVTVLLQDGTTQINPASIVLSFDGNPVVPSVQQAAGVTTVVYDPPGLLAPESSHQVRITAADNGAVPTRLTNDFSFSVLTYYNLLLPSPIVLETFDSTPEGQLPPGWVGTTYTAVADPNVDLGDLNSAAYANWIVVDSSRFNSPLLTYNTHAQTLDYQRVLTVNPANVVNGSVVTNLAQNKICFGDSGYRDGGYQYLYLQSPDFDCSAQTNVYLVYNSIWEQNQDSIGAVEYSIDQGATWLPLVYMIDRRDIVLAADGTVDAVATFSSNRNDIAVYIDPSDGSSKGGYYGAFIGVDSGRWSTLGPYISGRIDDDPIGSKRVEIFRLAAADRQSKVRLRFAHAGTDSWYFGIDNVGLYSLTSATPPLPHGPSPSSFTEAVGNGAVFTVSPLGVGPFTYKWLHNGSELPGQTGPTLTLNDLKESDAGNYTTVIGYIGGTLSAGPASLSVFVPPPSVVLGQWDFNEQNLAATAGRDLEFADLSVDLGTGFSDAVALGLPSIGGQSTIVMSFPGAGTSTAGYKMFHGLSGTGGGTNVNQYTLIMDVLYPSTSDLAFRALLQTDPNNASDASFFINQNNGLGVNGVYDGQIAANTWYRIALAVDLAGPGPNPIVAKFINGTKVGQQVLPDGRDGRWSLSASAAAPYALLFADNDVDLQPGYASSIQVRSGRLSDAAIAALGGPAASKIPGAVSARVEAGHVVIRWSGATLEGAADITGPWTPIAGATKPFTVPTPLGAMKYYRSL